jgi:hypothetical protein
MMVVCLSEGFGGKGTASRNVALREIRGEDELADLSASLLVERLIVGGTVKGGELSLAEQDRVLAETYRAIYGDRIECHAACVACGRAFEVSFALDDWLDSLTGEPAPEVRPGPGGTFELSADESGSGVRFRLPNEADLLAAPGRDEAEVAAALRRLCVIEGDPDDPRLEAAMAHVGPLLDDEIETECAYCGQKQAVELRLSDYLLAALERERPLVSREVHYLARAYHWSRPDILAMPRSSRREHVRMVLAESGYEERQWL